MFMQLTLKRKFKNISLKVKKSKKFNLIKLVSLKF